MECENATESCVQIIFNSGMLLNEHDELLIQFWKPMILKDAKYARKHLASTSALVGLITSIYRRSLLLGIMSVMPLGFQICWMEYTKYKWKCYKNQFQSLVTTLCDIFVIVKKILQHYQLQKATISNLSTAARALTKDLILNRMLKFLSDVGEIVLELILFLCKALKDIQNVVDIGDLNCIFNFHLDKNNFIINNTSEETILQDYDKIHMAYVYVTSTFLCGFGLSLCKSEWRSDNSDFPKLFSILVPEYLKYTKAVYRRLSNDFNALHNTLRNDSIENIPRNTNKPILNTIDSLKEQLQVSFNIAVALQKQLTSHVDNLLIQKYLEDLENLFTQSGDILRILQYNFYKVAPQEIERPVHTIEQRHSEEIDLIQIKHDDNLDDIPYEEFNLSIHGSDCSDESYASNLEYGQLLEYVKSQKLMIRELNEELRKRNIVKQDLVPIPAKGESVNKEIKNVESSLVPTMPIILNTERSNTNNEEKSPFPPPPLLSHDISSNLLATSTQRETDLLSQIREAAARRGVVETVFGDDIISSENSSAED